MTDRSERKVQPPHRPQSSLSEEARKSNGESPSQISGAWIVEIMIAALIILLIGKEFGFAITLLHFMAALALASAAVLAIHGIRRLR